MQPLTDSRGLHTPLVGLSTRVLLDQSGRQISFPSAVSLLRPTGLCAACSEEASGGKAG